jgi:hypothetical protein
LAAEVLKEAFPYPLAAASALVWDRFTMDMRTVNNNVKFQDFNRKQANSLLNIVKNIEHYPHLSPLCLTTEINLKNQLKELKEFCQGKIEEFSAPKLFAEQCCQWHGRLLKKNALVSCSNPP